MKKTYDDDDGKTIADMNIEGMPWYQKNSPFATSGGAGQEMSAEEVRAYRLAAVKASFLIVTVFGVAMFLLIAFMDFVWFGN